MLVITGFEDIIALTEFKLKKQINNHSKCYFKALINEKSTSKYLNTIGQVADIYFNENKILAAVVSEVNVIKKFSETYIEVIMYSFSILLDKKKNTRLFQNPKKTLTSILKGINSFEPGFDIKILDEIIRRKIIRRPIIQNNETDFEFINRMANENGVYLWLDDISNNHKIIKLYKNFNNNVKIISLEKVIQYKLKKDSLSEMLEITLQEYIDLEKTIQLENSKYIITKLELKKEKEEFLINYTLKRISNIVFEKDDENREIIKLKGKVVDNNDPERLGRIKVDFLDIMEIDNEEKIWIDYKTLYSNSDKGIIFIPEIGDIVSIEFDGKNFIASGSVREKAINKSYENLKDKYISNSFNKEIIFKEKSLEIQALDNSIKISDEDISIKVGNSSIVLNNDNVFIKCNDLIIKLSDEIEIMGKKINIKANEDITIKSSSDVNISGQKGINLN